VDQTAHGAARRPHCPASHNAYEAVDARRVKHITDRARVTDLVSLLRFGLGADDQLVPYGDRVRECYAGWNWTNG
jgi:hypothetical protein